MFLKLDWKTLLRSISNLFDVNIFLERFKFACYFQRVKGNCLEDYSTTGKVKRNTIL